MWADIITTVVIITIIKVADVVVVVLISIGELCGPSLWRLLGRWELKGNGDEPESASRIRNRQIILPRDQSDLVHMLGPSKLRPQAP